MAAGAGVGTGPEFTKSVALSTFIWFPGSPSDNVKEKVFELNISLANSPLIVISAYSTSFPP